MTFYPFPAHTYCTPADFFVIQTLNTIGCYRRWSYLEVRYLVLNVRYFLIYTFIYFVDSVQF